MRKIACFLGCFVLLASCSQPNLVEQHRAAKHVRDSVSLVQQQRSLEFYQAQLDSLMPVADSLLVLFKYEKNKQFQEHGYYVATGRNGLRILVRDDGRDILLYRDGKRQVYPDASLEGKDQKMIARAEHLQVTILDIRELEKRIQRTSLEVQKYQKRLQKQE